VGLCNLLIWVNIFGQGAGFGEFAILSTTQKLRTASAVAISEDSLLLIMHASTYEAVLKKFHYRQKALSSAIKLLQELPLFNFAGFTKLSQLAYGMQNSLRPTNSIIASEGEPMNRVFIIGQGSVQVMASTGNLSELTENPHIRRKMPRLCLCKMGRGQLIGLTEILESQKTFSATYISGSPDCEIYEVALTAYLNYSSHPSLQQSEYYKHLCFHTIGQRREQMQRIGRVQQQVVGMYAASGELDISSPSY
jgi:CRP-like cAMP-binding protein